MLYFLFIVAATLRLEFVLPAFTGLVAAIEYLALAACCSRCRPIAPIRS